MSGWNGDVRRIVQGRKSRAHHFDIPHAAIDDLGGQLGHGERTAPGGRALVEQLGCCTPSTALTEMNYHNYKIPRRARGAQLPASLRNDPLFNFPRANPNYHYILTSAPQVVEARTQIYSEFKAAFDCRRRGGEGYSHIPRPHGGTVVSRAYPAWLTVPSFV